MESHIQKVLITGGGGFIGSALTRYLLRSGVAVHNLDYIANRFAHPDLTHFQGSFLEHGLLREAMAGVDCVFHLAATGFAQESNANPARDAEENVIGTIKLLQVATELNINRMIFCSSGGTVYGPAETAPILESASTNPVTAYGVSKLACEKYMRLYDRHSPSGIGNGVLETVSLRVANPYGPGQNISKAQGALVTFCHRAVTGKPIIIWGDGTVERDYIDVRDVTEALYLAAVKRDVSGCEINIGSGKSISLNELIEIIAQKLGHNLDVVYEKSRGFDVQKNYLDISTAKKFLGWSPKINLTRGIDEVITHMIDREGAARA